MTDGRTYEQVKYTFTQTELIDLGQDLAHENEELQKMTDDKAAQAADYSARIKASNQRVRELTKKVSSGFELREVECMTMLETPRPGLKRIIRVDTNELLREEAMTVQEMQGSFGFQEGNAPDEPDDEPEPDGKSKGAGE